MVILITGILAASATVFFKPVVDSYFDTRRRAELTDLADSALRTMARDIRSAVPNSVRAPAGNCFELVPTSAGGRFRAGPDPVNDVGCTGVGAASTCSAPLDVTQPASVFDSLSQLSSAPAVGDWVVIDNQNGGDVYAGTNRAAITAFANLGGYRGYHRISIASTQFPSGYDGNRFAIVPANGGNAAVFYLCAGAGTDARGNGTGTLYRIPAAFAAAAGACPAPAGAVVATRISNCTFSYDPNQGATQQSGFVWMQLQLAEANETVSLAYGVHVDNAP